MTVNTSLAATDAVHEPIDERWWQQPFRMFQTNLREIDAGLDVESVLDRIEEHGANAWLLNAGGILAFHPSDLPFQTRNPWLAERPGGDLLGDAIDAAHARGIRLMARMDFSKVSARIAAEHPEWAFVSPSGRAQVYSGLVSVCPSGEYYQERTLDILDEVLDRYDVDGFFFNWFGFNEVDYSTEYHGVCHCANCERAFFAYAGLALPDGPTHPDYTAWLGYAAETIDALTAKIRSHIAQRKPEAGLILGRTADIMFHEANNALGRPIWPHATAEAVSAFRSSRPDVPVLVNAVAFFDMPYRMASEEPQRFAQYLVQAIARGANPSTYIMGVPGDIPYRVLAAAADVTRFHRDHEQYYVDAIPAATVALVLPDRLGRTASAHAQAVAEYRGIYLMLQQAHIPFDVVAQDGIADLVLEHGLSRYEIVVLPDLGPLDPDIAAMLDAFAHGGGRLVATGSTAVAEDGRVQIAALPATRRLAVTTDEEALKSTYVGAGDDGAYREPILPVYGAYHYFSWAPEAEPELRMLAHAPFGPPEKAYGNVAVEHPGFARRSSGRGGSLQFPWTPGRAYYELGLTDLRDTLVAAVRSLGVAPLVEADIDEQVEVSVTRSGDRIVVHLVNLSGVSTSRFGEPVPIRGGTLRIRTAATTAHSAAHAAACATRHDDGLLTIELPELGLFDVIVIDEKTADIADDERNER